MAASAGLGKVQNWTGWLAETLWWRGGREVDREAAGGLWLGSLAWVSCVLDVLHCTAQYHSLQDSKEIIIAASDPVRK